MARTYDIEWLLADAVEAYLEAKLDAAVKAECPVVTFYDPMAVDEQNRVVVMPTGGQELTDMTGSYVWDVAVTVKTLWAEPTLGTDFDNHRAWTSQVRDNLMSAALAADINTYAAGKLAVDRVMPGRGFSYDINKDPNYLLSEIRFSVRCHSIA